MRVCEPRRGRIHHEVLEVMDQMAPEEREGAISMARIMELGKGGKPKVRQVKVLKIRVGEGYCLLRTSNGQRLNPATTRLLP